MRDKVRFLVVNVKGLPKPVVAHGLTSRLALLAPVLFHLLARRNRRREKHNDYGPIPL